MDKKIVRYTIAGAAAVIVFLIAVFVYRYATRNAIEILVRNKKMINVLIEGNNVFNDDRHRFFAVLSVNVESKKIGITFIPPSYKIRLNRKGTSFKRIDELESGSFTRISESLGHDLKMYVPFYIELYSPDVKRIVDLIEGVDLFILDQAKSIPGAKIGLNYYDGEKVVEYINMVEGSSIFKKYDRIQDILYTLYYNRGNYKKFTGREFVLEAVKKIKTNLLDQEVLSLLKYMYDENELMCALLPGSVDERGYYIVDDIAYKLYEKEFLTKLVLGDAPDKSASVKVKILNGTSVPGLAKKMRNILNREGLNVVEFGTSPYQFMDATVVINQNGDMSSVRRVAEITGTNKIYHIVDSMQLNSALIIIGKDYLQGGAQNPKNNAQTGQDEGQDNE